MNTQQDLLTTTQKALTINLDRLRYGTFAEIGAGQEVARHFFQAGGAAGTVAKSISAYDMTFSDAIYGKTRRYVSSQRLQTMLDHEYELLVERLRSVRGKSTGFFVFADTVAARSYHGNQDCHGWLGLRFQIRPGEEPNDIVLHIRMWDKENVLQQQALGIVGVNLIYGAFYLQHDPKALIHSLVDNVGANRIEVEMIRFSGPAFSQIDNRLMSFYLAQFGLTNAVLFDVRGEVLQPAEFFYKKAVLLERGSFRPVTRAHLDMLTCASAQFVQNPAVQGKPVAVLAELTVNALLAGGSVDPADFFARVDLLAEAGFNVLISNFSEYHRLTAYCRRYTGERIAVTMGVNNLLEICNEKYYDHLEGGILESFGRLFRHGVRLYIYPMRRSVFEQYLTESPWSQPDTDPHARADSYEAGTLITARNLQVPENLRNLYQHLLENRYLECITGYDPEILTIVSRDVLHKIQADRPGWEDDVPERVASLIRERGFFGHGSAAQAPHTRPRVSP